ncbi:MAG: TlpA family protein disulfide reductase [Marinifilaceae bacterium]
MRNCILFFSVILSCLTWSCGDKPVNPNVTITGKAPQGAKKVTLNQRKGMMQMVAEVAVNDQGEFLMVIPVTTPSYYNISFDVASKDADIYAAQGDEIKVTATEEAISFDGSKKAINTFLLTYRNALAANQKTQVDMLDEMAYQQNVLDNKAGYLALVDNAEGLCKEFANVHRCWIELDALTAMAELPKYRKMFHKDETPLKAEYWNVYKGLDFSNAGFNNVPFAVETIDKVISIQDKELGYSIGEGMSDYLMVRASRIANNELREAYIMRALQIELYAYNQYLPEVMAKVEPMLTSDTAKTILEYARTSHAKQTEDFASLLKGQPAPNIIGTDAKGKEVSTAQFKGNVVLVDVWGTFCIPCIEEVPYLHKLEEHYKNDKVTFVALAMDNEEQTWLKYLNAKQLGGIQLFYRPGFKGEFSKQYKLRGVPRFIVIDKEGNIADAFAPRPSDPRLKTLIDQLL